MLIGSERFRYFFKHRSFWDYVMLYNKCKIKRTAIRIAGSAASTMVGLFLLRYVYSYASIRYYRLTGIDYCSNVFKEMFFSPAAFLSCVGVVLVVVSTFVYCMYLLELGGLFHQDKNRQSVLKSLIITICCLTTIVLIATLFL